MMPHLINIDSRMMLNTANIPGLLERTLKRKSEIEPIVNWMLKNPSALSDSRVMTRAFSAKIEVEKKELIDLLASINAAETELRDLMARYNLTPV